MLISFEGAFGLPVLLEQWRPEDGIRKRGRDSGKILIKVTGM